LLVFASHKSRDANKILDFQATKGVRSVCAPERRKIFSLERCVGFLNFGAHKRVPHPVTRTIEKQ
jgi:hypothetical protein